MVERPVGGDVILKLVDTKEFEVDVTYVSDGKGGTSDILGLHWLDNQRLVMTSNLDSGNGLYVSLWRTNIQTAGPERAGPRAF
jgi:hypothetical protein